MRPERDCASVAYAPAESGLRQDEQMKDNLLSLVSPGVAIALIAVVGTYFTARAAFADVTLKRRLETAGLFGELAGTVNNPGGGIGTWQQIAAIELLASFGRQEPHLRSAGRSVLTHIKDAGKGETAVSAAAVKLLKTYPSHDKAIRSWRRN